MEQFLIFSHIFCGGTVLLLGLFQMFNRKGGKNHIIIGEVYVAAMWWICLSALSIISFYRFSAFLMVIAVFTFYSSFVGVRVLKRKKLGTEKWYDWAISIATVLFGIGLIGYGAHLYFNTNNTILAFLCGLFGALTSFSAGQDLRLFMNPKDQEKKWWLYQHIGAMGGSYIAAITAFAVQNPAIFLLDGSSYQWLLWILPGVVGGPIISVTIKKRKAEA